jgi:hypothetical protein
MSEENFSEIDNLIQRYFHQRTAHYFQLHSDYRSPKELSTTCKSQLYKVVTTLDTAGSQFPLRVYDRNLVYCRKNEYEFTYHSVCPAAAKAIQNYYYEIDSKFMKWSLEGSASDSFNQRILHDILNQKHEFTGPMRDEVFEKLVIFGLIKKIKSFRQDVILKYYDSGDVQKKKENVKC